MESINLKAMKLATQMRRFLSKYRDATCFLLAGYHRMQEDKLKKELLWQKEPKLDNLGNSWPIQMKKYTKIRRYCQGRMLWREGLGYKWTNL